MSVLVWWCMMAQWCTYLDIELQHHQSDHLWFQSHDEHSSADLPHFHCTRDNLARLGHIQSHTGHWSMQLHLGMLVKYQDPVGSLSVLCTHRGKGNPAAVTDCSPCAFKTYLYCTLVCNCTSSQLNGTITAFSRSLWSQGNVKFIQTTYAYESWREQHYHCISLQHHHHGHSLNYKLLFQNWSSLTTLILLQYIQNCPGVLYQFHDQSRHWYNTVRLKWRIKFVFVWCCDSKWNSIHRFTQWRESKLSACHFSIIGSPVVITHCPPLTLIADLYSALSGNISTTEP